jgi:integrase
MRKSSQRGWITLRGKKWYGYFRKTVVDSTTNEQKRVRVPVALGLRSKMTKVEAQEALDYQIAIRTSIQCGVSIPPNGSISLGWFVRKRFFPLKEAMWRPETARVKKTIIERDLIEEFDSVLLQDLNRFGLQMHLNRLAKSASKDRVRQMRAYIRDIFSEAADQGFIEKDPTRKIRLPTQLRETDKTVLNWEQLRKVLSSVGLRDRVLLELGMTNALRPSELFALKWRSFNHQELTLTVTETVYKGSVRPWGKTRRSLGVIHIPQKLADDLLLWKHQCPDPAPHSFIFTDDAGSFIDSDSFRRKVLRPLATELELPKLTFQVIRRTIATLAQKKGTVKDVQGILRHSRAATTTDIYMQEIPESVRMTVTLINDELRGAVPEFQLKAMEASRP